jgi:hypothetical protein
LSRGSLAGSLESREATTVSGSVLSLVRLALTHCSFYHSCIPGSAARHASGGHRPRDEGDTRDHQEQVVLGKARETSNRTLTVNTRYNTHSHFSQGRDYLSATTLQRPEGAKAEIYSRSFRTKQVSVRVAEELENVHASGKIRRLGVTSDCLLISRLMCYLCLSGEI